MRNHTLRIIGGQLKRRHIRFPAARGIALRPSGDRIRETLFNWPVLDIHGARCLDAFAGSGILGMEALSRGAAHCTFIEKHPRVYQWLKQNLQTLQLEAQSTTLPGSCFKFIRQCQQNFDVIFLDPPFDKQWLDSLLDAIAAHAVIVPQGRVYIETAVQHMPEAFEPPWQLIKQGQAGEVAFGILEFRPDC